MPVPTLRNQPINDETALPNRPRKGRGAVSNRSSGRFNAPDSYETDDGWTHEERQAVERRQTILGVDSARTIISRNDSPDVGFSQSINPYKACEHGCIYYPITQFFN